MKKNKLCKYSNKFLVSYLVTSYNHDSYILNALKSINNQTYQYIEILIIDDCSTDNSADIIRNFKSKFPVTKILNKKNHGVNYCLNKLISIANGEYIVLCASDDWVKPNKTTKQIEFIVHNNYDAVLGPVIKYDQSTNTYFTTSVKKYVDNNSNYLNGGMKKYINDVFTAKGGCLLQSGMFKTEVMRNIKYDTNYKSDDWLFIINFFKKNYKLGIFNEALSYYRIHDNNSHKNAMYSLLKLQLPVIKNVIPKRYKPLAFANVYCNTAYKLLLNGDYISAVKYYRKSLKYDNSLYRCFLWYKYLFIYLLKKIHLYNVFHKIKYFLLEKICLL